jgi:hypothetical protein
MSYFRVTVKTKGNAILVRIWAAIGFGDDMIALHAYTAKLVTETAAASTGHHDRLLYLRRKHTIRASKTTGR